MENLNNSKKAKINKERTSNTSITTNESPFVSPVASPTIEPDNETVKISIIDDKLNDYKLPISKKNDKEMEQITETIETIVQIDKLKQENIKEINISLDSLILNLKILSKLKPGYKLSIKENNGPVNDVYIDTSYFQYVYRIFSDNSRDHTTKFLEMLEKEITKKMKN